MKGFHILMLSLLSLLITSMAFPENDSKRENDSLQNVLNTTSDKLDKLTILIKLGRNLNNMDPQKSVQLLSQAYAISIEDGYEEQRLSICLGLSLAYYMISDLKNAMQFALEARKLAEKLGIQDQLAVSNDAVGMVYYEIGDKKKSSEYFFQSLKIYEKLKDKNGLGQTFCRIGTLYLDQKEFDKALEYYTRSVQLAKEVNSLEGISSNLNNVAKVYAEKRDYNRAIQNYTEAIDINKKIGKALLEGSNYLNIAEVYSKTGKYATALEYIEKARGLFEKISNQRRIAKCQVTSAQIYLEIGEADKAITSALSALQIADKQGYHEVSMDAARLLHESYLKKADTGSAFHYYVLENQWKDSLSMGERQKTLTKLELQYQFEKNEQQEKIRQQRRMVIVGIIILILVFAIVIIILILNHIRLKAKKSLLEKENLEQELDFKKKELTLNVLSLMKKNEIFSDISEKLMTIAKESDSPETKSAIKKVGRELQRGQEDELWKEFTLRFKEVHKEFYNNLLSRFPNLSPNEQKLCAFLRLNMSSKEISELTGQSVSTIEIARHRLRQKLGITNSDVNLINFLSQI